MCVKAIRLDLTEELHHKILSAIIGEDRKAVHVKFADIANKIGVSEDVVRYNAKKLVKLGYIRIKGDGYEPTEKVIFIKPK